MGGLFRHVVDLARLQAAAGHQVGLVCDASTGGARAAEALAASLGGLQVDVVALARHLDEEDR